MEQRMEKTQVNVQHIIIHAICIQKGQGVYLLHNGMFIYCTIIPFLDISGLPLNRRELGLLIVIISTQFTTYLNLSWNLL